MPLVVCWFAILQWPSLGGHVVSSKTTFLPWRPCACLISYVFGYSMLREVQWKAANRTGAKKVCCGPGVVSVSQSHETQDLPSAPHP